MRFYDFFLSLFFFSCVITSSFAQSYDIIWEQHNVSHGSWKIFCSENTLSPNEDGWIEYTLESGNVYLAGLYQEGNSVTNPSYEFSVGYNTSGIEMFGNGWTDRLNLSSVVAKTNDKLKMERKNGEMIYYINGVEKFRVSATTKELKAHLSYPYGAPVFSAVKASFPAPSQETVDSETHTLTLQPGSEDGKDANLHMRENGLRSTSYLGDRLLNFAWTFGGVPGTYWSLIGWDLSSIPENATITSAKLDLFAHSNYPHSTRSGANDLWIERIIQPWVDSTVTWDNKPSTTTENRVALAASTSTSQNYLNIDVLNLIKDHHANPESSHGMMLKLQNDRYYRSMNFYSSGAADASKRPKLTITYDLPETNTNDGIDVVWTDLFQVEVNGNTINKSAENDGYSGGAASKNTLEAGEDGWVQIKAVETDKTRYFGLSAFNKDDHYNSIDYGMGLVNDKLQVYIKGQYKGQPTSFESNDLLKIERIGGTIYWKKNDISFYELEDVAQTNLIVDLAMRHQNGTIADAVTSFGIPDPITREGEDIVWYNESDVIIEENSVKNDLTINKVGGAASRNQLAKNTDGWVEFTILKEGSVDNFSFGFSQVNVDNAAASMDYRFWLYNGALRVYGKNNLGQIVGDYYVGDVIGIERKGGKIYFTKNGHILFEDDANSTTALIADASFNLKAEGAISHAKASFGIPTITERNGEKIVWEDLYLIDQQENAIVKQVNNKYGGAVSNQRLSPGEDGWIEFTISESNTAKYVGLSETNEDLNPQSIDYCFALTKTGVISIYEDWVHKKNVGSYYPEDVLSIERIGNIIYYKKNGVTLYTSTKESTASLLLDVTMYEEGGTINNARSSFEKMNKPTRDGYDAHWQKLTGGETDGNTYLKTSGSGWSANGVVSSNLLKANEAGWVETTITQDDKTRMIGFDLPGNEPRWAVAYGVYINGNNLSFYEEGKSKATKGIVYKDNILSIERNESKIEVYRNYELIYTFPTPSSSALIINGFAIADQSEIANVRASFPGCTDADGDGICEADDCNDNDPTVPSLPGSSCDDGDENTLEDLIQADSCSCIGTKLTASYFVPDTHEDDPNIRYSNGKVIIGDSTLSKPGNYRLYVEDGILTEKAVIAIHNTSAWADYVFDPNYPLLNLDEVETFIKKEGHLPEVPSAKEVVENGMNVGEIEATLLKKIEELWLHLIELNEKNKELKGKQEQLLQHIKAIEDK